MINIKNFDSNKVKLDGKPYKNMLSYYIGYPMIQDSKYIKINNMSACFNKLDRYFEKINGNKYLTLIPTDKSKEKNLKIWDLYQRFKQNMRFLWLNN